MIKLEYQQQPNDCEELFRVTRTKAGEIYKIIPSHKLHHLNTPAFFHCKFF